MSTDEADTAASATPNPPDDPEALRAEIERTRERLGETVEALAAKADVKAQAQQKVSQLTDRVKTGAGQARQQAAERAGQVQRQLADKTAGPRQKAASLAGPARDQVKQGTATAADSIAKVTPEPVKRAAGTAAGTAKRNRGPLAAAAGAIGAALVALLIILRLRKRS